MIAYYMFVNHGRFPSEYIDLPPKEKIFITAMALKEIGSRPKK